MCDSQSLDLQAEHGVPTPTSPHLARSRSVLGNLEWLVWLVAHPLKEIKSCHFAAKLYALVFVVCKVAVAYLRNAYLFQLENCSEPVVLEVTCVCLT